MTKKRSTYFPEKRSTRCNHLWGLDGFGQIITKQFHFRKAKIYPVLNFALDLPLRREEPDIRLSDQVVAALKLIDPERLQWQRAAAELDQVSHGSADDGAKLKAVSGKADLDVSIQSQILLLLEKLQAEYKLSDIFVAHDLAVVPYFCQRLAIMYLGRIVEQGERNRLFDNPLHPY
jgi:hypothetical protein